RQDDRSGVIPARVCLRPLGLSRPPRPVGAGGGGFGGAGRIAFAGRWGGGGAAVVVLLGGSCACLPYRRCLFDRGERLLAEFAEDVVGAPAELAGNPGAGARVGEPRRDP